LSNKYQIAETELFASKIQEDPYCKFIKKINNYVYPQLKENPFYGQNIKKLKGEYEGVYRYRIGDIRIFYIIDDNKIIVIMTDVEQRKDSYKKRK